MATLTTPAYGFPYPDGTERVADGDNAMGALALAVENALKPAAIRVERNTDQPVTASTMEKVNYQVIIREDDPHNDFTFVSGAITVARAGWYVVDASVQWAPSATGIRAVQLTLTAGIPAGVRHGPAATGDTHQGFSTLVYLPAGEVVKIEAIHSHSTNLNILAGGRTHLAVTRLGP